MIKFTFPVLEKLGFHRDDVYDSGKPMKCGVENAGAAMWSVYAVRTDLCFPYGELKKLPAEY